MTTVTAKPGPSPARTSRIMLNPEVAYTIVGRRSVGEMNTAAIEAFSDGQKPIFPVDLHRQGERVEVVVTTFILDLANNSASFEGKTTRDSGSVNVVVKLTGTTGGTITRVS